MDLLVSTEDVSVFGGPASIRVNVGVGEQGPRGTYIFTGTSRPTDPDAVFLDEVTSFSKDLQIKDLYINLNPSDSEYLYLYQYDVAPGGGSYRWTKTLRLIPNTALTNVPVLFYNGSAVTFISASQEAQTAFESADLSTIVPSLTEPYSPSAGDLWLDISVSPSLLKAYSGSAWVTQGQVLTGQYFPLEAYFDLEQLGTIDPETFNIQYSIIGVDGKAISSSISVGEVVTVDSTLPIYVNAVEATINPVTGEVTWAPITGLRTVHLLITAGVGA
jgi:hypothetical protein